MQVLLLIYLLKRLKVLFYHTYQVRLQSQQISYLYDFFGNLKDVGIIGRDENVEEYICETLTEDLFGTKNNPTKLRYYIELGLQYIRVIVPILIIVLGMLDFSKAVFAFLN